MDIKVTKDGHFVVSHENTINLKSGLFNISDLSLRSLQYEKFISEGRRMVFRIPTLKEILRLAKNRIFLDLDVKDFSHLPGVAKVNNSSKCINIILYPITYFQIVKEEEMQEQVDIKTFVQNIVRKQHHPSTHTVALYYSLHVLQNQAKYVQDLRINYGLLVMPKTGFNASNVDWIIKTFVSMKISLVEAVVDPSMYNFETIAQNKVSTEQNIKILSISVTLLLVAQIRRCRDLNLDKYS